MKQSFIIFCLSLFLIGNYHVVTDWCSDAGQTTTEQLGLGQQFAQEFSTLTQHNDDSDLCGHCGHAGFNLQAVAVQDLQVALLVSYEKPIFALSHFKSINIAPPTPPPVSNS